MRSDMRSIYRAAFAASLRDSVSLWWFWLAMASISAIGCLAVLAWMERTNLKPFLAPGVAYDAAMYLDAWVGGLARSAAACLALWVVMVMFGTVVHLHGANPATGEQDDNTV